MQQNHHFISKSIQMTTEVSISNGYCFLPRCLVSIRSLMMIIFKVQQCCAGNCPCKKFLLLLSVCRANFIIGQYFYYYKYLSTWYDNVLLSPPRSTFCTKQIIFIPSFPVQNRGFGTFKNNTGCYWVLVGLNWCLGYKVWDRGVNEFLMGFCVQI